MRRWTSYYGPPSSKPDCCGCVTRNRDLIVEPHDYGQHNGVIKLLTWQIGGSSIGPLPNWRWLEIDQISDAELLDQTFQVAAPPVPVASQMGQTLP